MKIFFLPLIKPVKILNSIYQSYTLPEIAGLNQNKKHLIIRIISKLIQFGKG